MNTWKAWAVFTTAILLVLLLTSVQVADAQDENTLFVPLVHNGNPIPPWMVSPNQIENAGYLSSQVESVAEFELWST